MKYRPVLIGMNNPQGNEAFDPFTPNTSGFRLLQFLKIRMPKVNGETFCKVFDRRNLIEGLEWDPGMAERHVRETRLWESLEDCDVVVFGNAVRMALDLPVVPKVVLQEYHGVRWRFLPHPSGRALWYNEQLSREMAALVLEELYYVGRRLVE